MAWYRMQAVDEFGRRFEAALSTFGDDDEDGRTLWAFHRLTHLILREMGTRASATWTADTMGPPWSLFDVGAA